MKKNKVLTTVILLAFTMTIALGTAWQPAAASHLRLYNLVADGTIEIGKQGIAATNIPVGVRYVAAGVVTEEQLPPRFDHMGEIEFRPPALEVRFLNKNGGTVDEISALVYVFFNIGKAERALWKEAGANAISIWFVSEATGKWEICSTFFVNENRDNGEYDRLSCLAKGSGYYVLGHGSFDELLFNPYTYDNMRVIDFKTKFVPY